MSLMFGFHMPNFTFADARGPALFDRVVEQAKAAEAAGFDLVTVMDHFYQIGGIGPETDPMLEAYTTLGAIARETTRVKLSTLVTGVVYRNPAVLAKQVTTLDVISNGRAMLGIGAAWNESESRGYGIEFPPIRAHGAAGRGGDDREAHVHRGAGVLPGQALQRRERAQLTAADPAWRPEDPDRRRR